jgi:magnesium-transporting ATPase (P-type)
VAPRGHELLQSDLSFLRFPDLERKSVPPIFHPLQSEVSAFSSIFLFVFFLLVHLILLIVLVRLGHAFLEVFQTLFHTLISNPKFALIILIVSLFHLYPSIPRSF